MENKIILYKNDQGNISINVTYSNESFWLSQKAIADLFGVEIPAISKHLKNIFDSGELIESSTVSKMETVEDKGFRANGWRRERDSNSRGGITTLQV